MKLTLNVIDFLIMIKEINENLKCKIFHIKKDEINYIKFDYRKRIMNKRER